MLTQTNTGGQMLTFNKDGKKVKIKNKDFKKYFADLMAEHSRVEILKALKENINELDGDGHSILDPEFYITKVKLPSEFVFRYSDKHYSDFRDYKSTITNTKFGVCDYIFGVYNLSMLEALCRVVGWDKELRETYSNMSGRGFMARVCLDNLKKQIELLKDEDLTPKEIDPCQYIN